MKKCYIEKLNKVYRRYYNPFFVFMEDELPAEFEGVCWYDFNTQLPLSEHYPVEKDYYTRLIKYVEDRMKWCEELYLGYLQRDFKLCKNDLIFHNLRYFIDRILRGLYIEHPEVKSWGLLILDKETMRNREYYSFSNTVDNLVKKKEKKNIDLYLGPDDYVDIPDEIKGPDLIYYPKDKLLTSGKEILKMSLGEFIIGWYDKIIDQEEWIMRYRTRLLVDYDLPDIQNLYENYLGRINMEVDELFEVENIKQLENTMLGRNITETYPWHAKLLFTITHQ